MKRYISIINTLAFAGMALMLTGCGDPVLDLSGDRESQKDSLMDVIKSYDTEDRIAFLCPIQAEASCAGDAHQPLCPPAATSLALQHPCVLPFGIDG